MEGANPSSLHNRAGQFREYTAVPPDATDVGYAAALLFNWSNEINPAPLGDLYYRVVVFP